MNTLNIYQRIAKIGSDLNEAMEYKKGFRLNNLDFNEGLRKACEGYNFRKYEANPYCEFDEISTMTSILIMLDKGAAVELSVIQFEKIYDIYLADKEKIKKYRNLYKNCETYQTEFQTVIINFLNMDVVNVVIGY